VDRAIVKLSTSLAFAATLFIPIVAYAETKPRIIVVTHGQAVDSFWSVVRNGVETAAKETDTTVDYRWPDTFDVQGMAQLIDEAVAAKPDALVVSIPDAKALSKSIKAAVAAKIPVISINSRGGSIPPSRVSHVNRSR
jgi:simple sugar transport system substrate-binding protein